MLDIETLETQAVPGPGTLVTVRRRQWVVDEVRRSGLPPKVVRPEPLRPMHLVDLTCVEDDALGEELQVVWEIEPGACVHENLALPEPEGFDEPARLDGFLDAVRWGAVINADREVLQAPFRSGIEIEEYQLEPVVRCLEMPRVSLLLADDVGLGKTIESGLVAQELILRNRVRTILVLCPASLCVQWKEQMRDKFGLEFRIVDRDLMQDLRRTRGIRVNPWTHFPRLIASIDFFKRERPLRLFRETLPTEVTYPRSFDLLIVDEAHNVAPIRTALLCGEACRRELESFLVREPRDGERKAALLAEAQTLTAGLRRAADLLVAVFLSTSGRDTERQLALLTPLVEEAFSGDWNAVVAAAEERLNEGLPPGASPRRPFHWVLEFPEVFSGESPGFDAVIGNPAFQGGQKITGALGTECRNFLVERLAGGQRGSADLCAYFFLRLGQILRPGGTKGAAESACCLSNHYPDEEDHPARPARRPASAPALRARGRGDRLCAAGRARRGLCPPGRPGVLRAGRHRGPGPVRGLAGRARLLRGRALA